MRYSSLLTCLLSPLFVNGLASTDSIQDGDIAQSGYLANHNMHPATVGSSIFGQLWKIQYGKLEVFYAKPLVYTPPSTGKQLVFTASNMNNIRTIDAVTGAAVNTRLVQSPFLSSDLGCGDIPNYVGIIGTPIIDPATDIAYFFSKGYKGGAASGGVPNGQYLFYAVDVKTLLDIPGFPITVEGHNADNDPTRYFVGGTVLQRPALAMVNGVIIGGFGGHCDLFNYTGMLVAISTTAGVGVTSLYAMEASPGAPTPQPLDLNSQNGGKAGIWQSGMGLATDGSRIFLATGNGQGHANGDVPSSGRTPLSTLDEVVANFQVSPAGKLSLTDYFEPYEYVNMDAADRDLGSSGVTLLDPTVFKGQGVTRMAVVVGKNGKAYILDANALGGFKQGPGGTDGILQTIVAGNSVFGGTGSYPLEGGYIYFTPIGLPTVCYKIGLDGANKPVFTLVGQTQVSSAGRVGVGIPTVTTYQGQAGTGILWITDVNLGLRAFNAVPVNNVLVPISLPALPGLAKFQRPVFGDTRLYVSDSSGGFYCLGSPVALPLNCTQPVEFGSLAIGSTTTATVTCQAQIPITKINGCQTSDKTFQCQNSSLPQGALAQGARFSFPVVWNLTQSSINDAQNASFGKVLPGVQSAVLDIYTTNGVAKYGTDLPVSLRGTTISKSPYLAISPQEVDFGGVVIGSASQDSGLSAAIIVSNVGSQVLQFTGFAWDDATESDVYNNLTQAGDGSTVVGSGVTSLSFPDVGSTVPVGSSVTIPLNFKASVVGKFSSLLTIWSNGGSQYVLLVGSAATPPIANISVSIPSGGWNYSSPTTMQFGSVLAGQTVVRNIRICNSGGSVMHITKSKPPVQPELTALDPTVDLHEGQAIDVNTCSLGAVSIPAAFQGPNRPAHSVSDVWVLNSDGLNSDGSPFGVREVAISANIITRQVGVLLPNGTARYQYLGCYYDGGGRLLDSQLSYTQAQGAANENGQCQQGCFAAGWTFSATEYHTECWCGNTPPPAAKLATTDKMCNFACPGDGTQACGGDGTYMSLYYDILKYAPAGAPLPSSSAFSSTSMASSTSISSTNQVPPASTSLTSSQSSISTTTKASSSSVSSQLPTSVSSSSTSVTSSAAPTQTVPSIKQTIGLWQFQGCWTESTTGRALSSSTYANNSMTLESCAAFCKGYKMFGTEYGRECYCGNVLNAGSVKATNQADCLNKDFLCPGNKLEYCGGSSRLELYSLGTGSSSSSSALSSTSSSSSSMSSSKASSSSSTPSFSSTSSSSTLPPSSTSVSSSKSSTLSSSSSSSVTPSTSSTTVQSTTLSTSTTTSKSTSTLTSTPTTAQSSSSLSSTTSSAPSTVPTTTGPGAFNYQGCYVEPPTARALTGSSSATDTMTLEKCAAFCSKYAYFGTEYGRECYCGNALTTGTVQSGSESDCSFACAGNAGEICGSGGHLSLFFQQVGAAAPGPNIGSFAPQGCYTEGNGVRALSAKMVNDQVGMTNEVCASACQGYTYFGTEYSSECYCGNTLGAGSVLAPATDCNMDCPGDASNTETCGDRSRLTLYKSS